MRVFMPSGRHALFLLLAGAGVLVPDASAEPQKPVMRDAATHEQLSKALLKVQENDPMKNMKPSEAKSDPSKKNQPAQDLFSQSDVICFRGYATLVPKRAVIQKPKNLEERLVLVNGAKIVSWPVFYKENRGWITAIEVSRSQAEGNAPLAEDVVKMMEGNSNLIVATYQGGPISVLPLKVVEPTHGKTK